MQHSALPTTPVRTKVTRWTNKLGRRLQQFTRSSRGLSYASSAEGVKSVGRHASVSPAQDQLDDEVGLPGPTGRLDRRRNCCNSGKQLARSVVLLDVAAESLHDPACADRGLSGAHGVVAWRQRWDRSHGQEQHAQEG
jgi:hypothetical protein